MNAPLIKLAGKARQVFTDLALYCQQNSERTLGQIKAKTICEFCGADLNVWREERLGEHNHYDAGGGIK